jgi:hypothetical protein
MRKRATIAQGLVRRTWPAYQIEEVYEHGVRALTTPGRAAYTYEVFQGEVLVWSRRVYFDAGHAARVETAREQDAFATKLARGK